MRLGPGISLNTKPTTQWCLNLNTTTPRKNNHHARAPAPGIADVRPDKISNGRRSNIRSRLIPTALSASFGLVVPVHRRSARVFKPIPL